MNASEPPALQTAGFWIRAAARVVDYCAAAIGALFLALLSVIANEIDQNSEPARILALMNSNTFVARLFDALAVFSYHAVFEGIAGTTAGKRVFGLQVLSMEGTSIHFVQAVKRSLGFYLDVLFFGGVAALIMENSPEKQRFGDRWANTRVVRRASVATELRAPTLQFIAAFIAAVEVATLMMALGLILDYWTH